MTGIQIKGRGSFEAISARLMLLADTEVLAGFPDENADRQEMGAGITNASLAYIHDHGAPEQNIPARPFMAPAMAEARDKVAGKLSQVLTAVVSRGADSVVVEQGLHQVGLIAKLAIQNKINEGIPPPLADATLRARARRGRKGAGLELLSRSMGYAPSMDFAKTLVDTGQMRNAADYAIRSRKKRN